MKVLSASMESGDLSLHHFNLGNEYDNGIQLISTETIAGSGKSGYIQKMRIIQEDEDSGVLVIVARRGHLLQVYNGDTLKLIHEWKPSTLNVDPSDSVVGLEYSPETGIVYTCTVSGKLMVRDIKNGPLHMFGMAKARDPISCLRLHPRQKGLLAFGGKDNDVELVHCMFSSREPDNEEDDDDFIGNITYSNDMVPRAGAVIDGNAMRNPVLFDAWKARSFKKDHQGNEMNPIWISDIQFLATDRPRADGWRLAAVTRYGELKIYETNRSKRPLITVSLSPHPIASLSVSCEETKLFFTDVQRLSGVLDTRQFNHAKFYSWAPGTSLFVDTCFPDDISEDISETNANANGSVNLQDHLQGLDESLYGQLPLDSSHGSGNTRYTPRISYGRDIHQTTDSSSSSGASSDEEEEDDDDNDEDDDDDEDDEAAYNFDNTPEPVPTSDSEVEAIQSFATTHNRSQLADLMTSSSANEDHINTRSPQAPITTDTAGSTTANRRSLRSTRPLMITGGLDSYVRIYDLNTGQLQGKLDVGSKVSSVCMLDTNEHETLAKQTRIEPKTQENRKRTRSLLRHSRSNS